MSRGTCKTPDSDTIRHVLTPPSPEPQRRITFRYSGSPKTPPTSYVSCRPTPAAAEAGRSGAEHDKEPEASDSTGSGRFRRAHDARGTPRRRVDVARHGRRHELSQDAPGDDLPQGPQRR